MRVFDDIVKPHRDILEERFTMDTYAARLWEVFKGEGPAEYSDAASFFEKTYVTEGLETLLSRTERRLKGQGGDAIIQLETPFGGGKTHTLIALFHKANEWDAKPIVIVGSEMDAQQTLWSEIEKQLTGRVQRFRGLVAPGSASISRILNKSRKPVLILMDEVLHYLARADGVSVGKSTSAEQTLAFVQSLSESVTACKNVTLIATLQSGGLGRYGQNAESLSGRFAHVLGRVKRKMNPVADAEIAKVIRKRLFSSVDEARVKSVVDAFVDYADEESILPAGMQKSEYRDRFVASYPFQPEVIDVLYQRWGAFPEFQRTRAVLRLLSLVIATTRRRSSKGLQTAPYISLADFDLCNVDLRGELLEHAGQEYSGIIAMDITATHAGAKAVDKTLGAAYKNLELGTRAATATFLYSFSGGPERGATLMEIKRSVAQGGIPAVTIDLVARQLRESLFYLSTKNGKLYFDNQPNLTRLLQIRMENVDTEVVAALIAARLEKSLIRQDGNLKTFLAPTESKAIKDTPDLKLIVLPQREDEFIKGLLETCGEKPRVYRNTLFFLTSALDSANRLETAVKRHIACCEIRKDESLNLSDEQKTEVDEKCREAENALNDALRRHYRAVLVPAREGFREEELGLAEHGAEVPFDEAVYDKLVSNGAITETIHHRIILTRYLKDNEAISTAQLFHASFQTPGEQRIRRDAWVSGIRKGVEEGLFGLGLREEDGRALTPLYFRQELPATEIRFEGDEMLMQAELCMPPGQPTIEEIHQTILTHLDKASTVSTVELFRASIHEYGVSHVLRDVWVSGIRKGVKEGLFGLGEKKKDGEITLGFYEQVPRENEIVLDGNEVFIRDAVAKQIGKRTSQMGAVQLRFTLPKGTENDVAKIVSSLQHHFANIEIALTATEGEISKSDYDNRIKEAFDQLGIDIT